MENPFNGFADFAGAICVLASALGCIYALAAARLTRLFPLGHPSDAGGTLPSVTILKPLNGLEPGLHDNLARFFTQDYAAPVQIVFGVQDQNDPAIEVVRGLMKEFPSRDCELIVNPRAHGLNRKVSNLINMAEAIKHDVVVLSDSDIVVERDYLRDVIAALASPGIGAVTCLYRGIARDGFWARLQAASINYHFLPGILVGLKINAAQPCLGSTIALRSETLAQIGGFQAVANQLADDYVIGELVRGLGLTVAVAPVVVAHACNEHSASSLYRHEVRWARTIRFLSPAGFIGSAITHPLPFALVGGVLGSFDLSSCCVILGALATRLYLQTQVESKFGLRDVPFWIGPVRDMLSFVVFVASFFGNGVDWRQQRYSVRADGSLAHAGEIVT